MNQVSASHDAGSSFDGVLGVDLGCPQCGYNLRGLAGPVAACPECGLRSNLGALATQRWDKRWYQAPGFNTIVLPALWVFVALIGGVFYLAAVSHTSGTSAMLMKMLYPVVALGIWVALLGMIWNKCGGWSGVWYALIAHLALVALIFGATVILAGLVTSCLALFEGPDLFIFCVGLLLIVFGITPLMMGRRAEKAVVGHCIRLHLKHRVTS